MSVRAHNSFTACAHAGSGRNKAAAAAVSKRYGSAAAAFVDGLPPPDQSRIPPYAADGAQSDDGERGGRSEKKVCNIMSAHRA